eukprot:827903-Pyramimonas_sp.AAC.1
MGGEGGRVSTDCPTPPLPPAYCSCSPPARPGVTETRRGSRCGPQAASVRRVAARGGRGP